MLPSEVIAMLKMPHISTDGESPSKSSAVVCDADYDSEELEDFDDPFYSFELEAQSLNSELKIFQKKSK